MVPTTPRHAVGDHNTASELPENVDLVSFGDVLNACDRAADYLEIPHGSRISDHRKRKGKKPLFSPIKGKLPFYLQRTGRKPTFSSESSSTEYSSSVHSVDSVSSPQFEELRDCACSGIIGRQEVVFIHMSSNSDCSIDIVGI